MNSEIWGFASTIIGIIVGALFGLAGGWFTHRQTLKLKQLEWQRESIGKYIEQGNRLLEESYDARRELMRMQLAMMNSLNKLRSTKKLDTFTNEQISQLPVEIQEEYFQAREAVEIAIAEAEKDISEYTRLIENRDTLIRDLREDIGDQLDLLTEIETGQKSIQR